MSFAGKVGQARVHITIAFILALFITASNAAASQPCAVDPAAAGMMVLPNVLMIIDSSGSMLYAAYPNDYSNSTQYYGLFDPAKKYNYNTTGKYFVENASGSWSGNFLNWATITRWDVAIYVLTGQRYVDVSSQRFLVTNPDNRSNDTSFNDHHSYNDTDDVTPYSAGTSRLYKAVPFYRADDHDATITDNRWSYLQVYNGTTVTYTYYYLRLQVASDYQPQGLLNDLKDKVRFGFMHFNDNEGGYIQRYLHTLDSTTLSNVIADLHRPLVDETSYYSNYIFTTWTPLGETLYEATRYFRQVSPYYSSADYLLATASPADQTRDPFYFPEFAQKLRCAKNYVIIVTDGEATQDQNIPVNDDATPARPLRDADGDGCDAGPCPAGLAGCGYEAFSCAAYPFDSSNNGSAYLDDVAYYAYHNDLRSDLADDQTITTHTVFAFGSSSAPGAVLLSKTAANGGGQYFLATNATALTDALTQIFAQINKQAAAAASTAITSEPVSGVDMIYIPYYKHPSEDQWWGNVRAFRLSTDPATAGDLLAGDTGTTLATDTDGDLVLDSPKWDAILTVKTKADADTRTMYTYIPGSGANPYPFDTAHVSDIGKYFDVDLNSDGSLDTPAEDTALIDYIRGKDNPSGGFTVRGRNGNYVGDIMHANPTYVGNPAAGYDLIYGDSSYWDFYWANHARTPVLYAAANDGMLHCFDASNGQELWTYIPYNLLPHLKWLADPAYCHTYYVDLTSNVWDIKLASGWKSVLVGGMRIGGTPINVDTDNNGTTDTTLRSALFALDVTDPNNPKVLWEINDDSFGYTTSKPIPVKVKNNWYLVFGSGPKSRNGEGAPTTSDGYADNTGHIFVVDLNTDEVHAIDLGTLAGGDFFGSPVAIDYDLDYSVDMIYIGDAKGNLWRIKTFTVAGDGTKTYADGPSSWAIDVTGVASVTNPQPLLSLGTDQPILIKPTVTKDDKGRVWVYFGTGRYFCANDNSYCGAGNACPASGGGCTFSDSVGTRSKYMAVGVYDRHWYTDTVNPANSKFVLQGSTLGTGNLDHRVIKQGTVVGTGATAYYVVDAATGKMATDVTSNGWYFHLLDDKERSLGDYTLYKGEVLFISFEPDVSDPCINGGISNLYGVSYTSGTSTTESVFDINGDQIIDINDLVHDAAGNTYSVALKKLKKSFAGGSIKVKAFDTPNGPVYRGYTPLPDNPELINLPGNQDRTGITSWKEVLQ
jgi:type IV pilus assembly protein PilY1